MWVLKSGQLLEISILFRAMDLDKGVFKKNILSAGANSVEVSLRNKLDFLM